MFYPEKMILNYVGLMANSGKRCNLAVNNTFDSSKVVFKPSFLTYLKLYKHSRNMSSITISDKITTLLVNGYIRIKVDFDEELELILTQKGRDYLSKPESDVDLEFTMYTGGSNNDSELVRVLDNIFDIIE